MHQSEKSVHQEVFNSQLNDSISKALYSFSKSPRFQKNEYSSNCAKAFYDLPKVSSSRATSLGFGTKLQFGALGATKSPGPESYKMKSEFDNAVETKKGYVFGVGREKMTQQSILAHVTKEGPGPGKYDSKDSLSNIKFTMRPKLDDARRILTLPGPGSYQIPTTITERGEHPVSRFRNSGACIINPNGSRFADDQVSNAPGPGQYDYEKTCINKDGKYFINKFKSTSQNTFTHSKRLTGEFGPQEKTPGPGAYKMPSDFGRLERPKFPSMIA